MEPRRTTSGRGSLTGTGAVKRGLLSSSGEGKADRRAMTTQPLYFRCSKSEYTPHPPQFYFLRAERAEHHAIRCTLPSRWKLRPALH
jgi:hypothetical protein